jgi:hypothetical protein
MKVLSFGYQYAHTKSSPEYARQYRSFITWPLSEYFCSGNRCSLRRLIPFMHRCPNSDFWSAFHAYHLRQPSGLLPASDADTELMELGVSPVLLYISSRSTISAPIHHYPLMRYRLSSASDLRSLLLLQHGLHLDSSIAEHPSFCRWGDYPSLTACVFMQARTIKETNGSCQAADSNQVVFCGLPS